MRDEDEVETMGPNNRDGCRCIQKGETKLVERTIDNKFHMRPQMVGNSILLYGRKNSRFPMQMFIGPEWPCMLMTNILILVPSYFFLVNVASQWHIAVQVCGIITTAVLMCAFLSTACTDPGVVWVGGDDSSEVDVEAGDTQGKTQAEKLEAGTAVSPSIGRSKVRGKMIMCGMCNIDRPVTAKHCHECGVCVDELDHHCPWTGKCIAKKNLTTFYAFLWSLMLHIGFVIAMVIASASADKTVT
jgi:palmitoyltransferase ZDHHC9/14/18